jgi:hypothetical protein
MKEKTPNLWMIRFNDKYNFSKWRPFDIVENVIKKNTNISLVTGNYQTLNLLNKFKTKHKTNLEFIDNNEICALDLKDNSQINLKNDETLFFNEKFYKSYYFAIQLMERNEKFSGDISFEERNYAIYKQVEFWNKKIDEKKPTSIIFFDIPHTYYELVLLAICEEKKIPCLIIYESFNIDKSVFLNGKFQLISGYGGEEFEKISQEFFDLVKENKESEINTPLNQDVDYFAKLANDRLGSKGVVGVIFILKKLFKIIYNFLLRRNKKYKHGYYIKTNYFEFGFNYYLRESIQEFFYAWNCFKFKFLYKRLSFKADYDCDFVYLPLISGYENAFHPTCSPLNIFIILDYLLNILPENCLIYIKEHPGQFRFRYHQRFSRSKNFYYKIRNMKRVKFIDINENHYKLISKSKFVVGSSLSSAALQAAAMKKEYKYYGFDFISNEYIKPLFNKKNKNIFSGNIKFFHKETQVGNANLDPISLASKIIDWSKDNL